MAKTWTLREAAKAIHENDVEGIQDLCRRFPLLSIRLAKVDYENVKDLLEAIPDYVTGLKMERTLMGEDGEDEEEGNGADGEGSEEGTAPATKGSEPEEDESPEERKRRINRERQQRKRAKDKAVADAKKEAEEAQAEEDESKGKYDEIGAVELYKMCKARGIATEPKKAQRHYIDLLEADDMKVKPQEEDDEDDTWNEEEEPAEEKPKKPEKAAKKGGKGSPSKKEPEPSDEDDDDDDGWNI